MQTVLNVIVNRLRKNDIVSRCSKTQYVILLGNIDYYNVVNVMNSIRKKIINNIHIKNVEVSFEIEEIVL